MKKIITTALLTLIVLINLSSCSKDENALDKLTITKFEFKKEFNSQLNNDIQGVIDGTNIVITMFEGTNFSHLKPSIEHNGINLYPNENDFQDFTKPVKYYIENESSSKYYNIIIKLIKSTDKSISSFEIYNEYFFKIYKANIVGKDIIFDIPLGENLSKVSPIIKYSGVKISPALIFQEKQVFQDFTKENIIYTVTAQDGSTNSYNIKINIIKPDEKVYILYNNGGSSGGGLLLNGFYFIRNLTQYTNLLYEKRGDDIYTLNELESYKYSIKKNGNDLYKFGEGYSTHLTLSNYIFSNNDIYCAGYESGLGRVWKNGSVLFEVRSDKQYYDSIASSVFVSNNDVYYSGNINSDSFDGERKTSLYKNNSILYNLRPSFNGMIAINMDKEGNVYCGGDYISPTYYYKAIVYKNGVPIYTSETNNSKVEQILFDKDDIYVLISEYNGKTYKLLKNYEELYTFEYNLLRLNSIKLKIYGNDIYALGIGENSDFKYAFRLWKNGISIFKEFDKKFEDSANPYDFYVEKE